MKINSTINSLSINSQVRGEKITTTIEEEKRNNLETYFRENINYPSVGVMGFNVFSSKLNGFNFSFRKTVINTINAHSFVVAQNDKDFSNALQFSDVLIPDGFPIVMAAKMLKNATIYKIAGEDLFFHLLHSLNKSSGSCFFLGSTEKTLEKIKSRLEEEYPHVKATFYSPPFKQQFSEEDNKNMIQAINQYQPDVLFVGMTAPKQEKWVHENAEYIHAKTICSIGAVFDFYARNIKRPSKFWRFLRLEWFIRLVKEPRRLWRRYLVSSPIFFKYLFLYKFGFIKDI